MLFETQLLLPVDISSPFVLLQRTLQHTFYKFHSPNALRRRFGLTNTFNYFIANNFRSIAEDGAIVREK